MRADVAAQYYQAMARIEAEETLISMSVSDHPHNKPESRKKFHRSLHLVANPESFAKKPVHSLEQLVAVMGGKSV